MKTSVASVKVKALRFVHVFSNLRRGVCALWCLLRYNTRAVMLGEKKKARRWETVDRGGLISHPGCSAGRVYD